MNVPEFLRFGHFMTHIVHFEKVYFLFFSLLKCLVSCQFLMDILHLIKMQSKLWLAILRNRIGSKFKFLPKKRIRLEKELKILNDPLLKHEGNNYGEFSVCLEHLLLPSRTFGFISRKKILK